MDDIDKEKIRELNESLSELTGTVNVAEKAVERVVERLGFGDKLKNKAEERAKAEDKATASVEKSTTAIDEERKKREESSKSTAEIFKKELSYRKVQLDANNQLVSTVVRLTQEQRNQLRMADKLNEKERQRMAFMDAPGKAMSGLADKFSTSESILRSFNDNVLSLTSNSAGLTTTFLGAKAVIVGFTDAATVMTKSLYKGERGAIVSANAFGALVDAIAPFIKALGPIVSILSNFTPIGRGLKLLAWGATAAGFGLEKFSEGMKVAAEQNDSLFKSFNALSQSGLTTAEGMTGVFDQLQTLGMTVAEIDKFNAIYKTNAKDLKLFGATAADGAKKFAEVAGTLYKSDLGQKLELLGVTADEQREHTLRYMSQQTRMGLVLGKTQEQQIQGAKAYIEELDRLAMLTGTNRKEQEESREAIAKIDDLRAAQYEAEQRGDTKTAKLLEGYFKAASAIYKFDPRGAKGIAEFGAAGGPTGPDSSAAMLTYGRGINAIKAGKSTEEVLQEMSISAKAMLKSTAGTRRIGGDVSGLLSGKFPEMVDFVKSIEAATELQRKEGGTLKEALDKIQIEKEKGLDKDTKNNVEALRKQQAAAMLMDSVVKTYNYSSILNKEASETFSTAVNKFANTVGANKPTGGVPVNATNKVFGDGGVSIPTSNQATSRIESAQQKVNKAKEFAEKNPSTSDASVLRNAEAELRAAKNAKELGDIANRNRGLRSGQSASSLKELGLKLKEGDVQVDGAPIDPKLIDIAKKVQETVPGFTRFNSFNDKYHNEKGKPGSLHSQGKAFDFSLNYKPTVDQGKEITKMLKDLGAGYVQDEYNFPSPGSTGGHIHVQLAKDGGAFAGPSDGYPVMLHNKEVVLNKIQTDKLSRKLEQVEKRPVETAIPELSSNTTSQTTMNTEVVAMLEQFTNVMENKMDAMIDVLNNGNDISGKILTYSMA